MQRDDFRSMPRRTFAKYGLLSTGVLTGSVAGTADATRDVRESESAPDRTSAERGVMFPYQVVPGRRVTVAERDLEWRPPGLESTHRTHAISYDHAPSLRAFLFTESNASVRSDRPIALGRVRGSVSGTDRSAVTVGLEPVDPVEPADSGDR